jgi:Na+-driven multidrug efflux pump
MILDPIFIYTLNLGITGAAIATLISIFIELLIILYWMFIKKDTYFKYTFKNFKINWGMYKEILNVGIPAGLEELLMAVVAIAVNLIFEIVGGTSAVATYTINKHCNNAHYRNCNFNHYSCWNSLRST